METRIEGFEMVGNWSRQAELLKDKFFELTDEDLRYEPGKELELLYRLTRKLRKNIKEVISIIRKLQPMKQ